LLLLVMWRSHEREIAIVKGNAMKNVKWFWTKALGLVTGTRDKFVRLLIGRVVEQWMQCFAADMIDTLGDMISDRLDDYVTTNEMDQQDFVHMDQMDDYVATNDFNPDDLDGLYVRKDEFDPDEYVCTSDFDPDDYVRTDDFDPDDYVETTDLDDYVQKVTLDDYVLTDDFDCLVEDTVAYMKLSGFHSEIQEAINNLNLPDAQLAAMMAKALKAFAQFEFDRLAPSSK